MRYTRALVSPDEEETLDFAMYLLGPLMAPSAIAEIIVLLFLELALGIDNLVFIVITSERLPTDKQHIGRRLGLAAAMVMRCILLCLAVWLLSINIVLFTLPVGFEAPTTSLDVHDLVFLVGGIYLVYKGIFEMRESFISASEQLCDGEKPQRRKTIGLARAVGTIMVMDIVFSLDSVITAAGLSGHILVMIIAVIGAVSIMIVFADAISDFINNNHEIKVVALAFIVLVGVELIVKGLHVDTIAGAPISSLLYAMMIFGFMVAVLIMCQRRVRDKGKWRKIREALVQTVASKDENASTHEGISKADEQNAQGDVGADAFGVFYHKRYEKTMRSCATQDAQQGGEMRGDGKAKGEFV